jgi:acyl-CoA thioesterase-1
VLSAVPLSYWLYAAAIGMTLVWVWREQRAASTRSSTPRGQESIAAASHHDGKTSPQLTPDPLWLRRATAAIWLGIVALELPHQFSPWLEALGNPPLYVIGDSVTAGMGGPETTWPAMLPASLEVHNLSLPGAKAASALKRQAPKLPAQGGLVLIEIGGNDLLGVDGSAGQFERDLEALLQQVCGGSAARGATAGLPSSAQRTVVMFELPLPPLSNEYGRIQRRLAARYGVRLIPKRVLMGVLSHGGATLDSIHLTPAGHQRMAEAVWAVIGPAYGP